MFEATQFFYGSHRKLINDGVTWYRSTLEADIQRLPLLCAHFGGIFWRPPPPCWGAPTHRFSGSDGTVVDHQLLHLVACCTQPSVESGHLQTGLLGEVLPEQPSYLLATHLALGKVLAALPPSPPHHKPWKQRPLPLPSEVDLSNPC